MKDGLVWEGLKGFLATLEKHELTIESHGRCSYFVCSDPAPNSIGVYILFVSGISKSCNFQALMLYVETVP